MTVCDWKGGFGAPEDTVCDWKGGFGAPEDIVRDWNAWDPVGKNGFERSQPL
ncbi:protein of unknown function [Methylocaldum szegediense]|uniref:Uncharacterized protein n=1 Tax=Methylocaldum szegediense TaxID=73780 RepID=A0ABN8X202_9GAMM|nr:protein of unknown function [Methylocaldum szegediense]